MPLRVVEQRPDPNSVAPKGPPCAVLIAILELLSARRRPIIPYRTAAIAELVLQSHSDLQPDVSIIGGNGAQSIGYALFVAVSGAPLGTCLRVLALDRR